MLLHSVGGYFQLFGNVLICLVVYVAFLKHKSCLWFQCVNHLHYVLQTLILHIVGCILMLHDIPEKISVPLMYCLTADMVETSVAYKGKGIFIPLYRIAFRKVSPGVFHCVCHNVTAQLFIIYKMKGIQV